MQLKEREHTQKGDAPRTQDNYTTILSELQPDSQKWHLMKWLIQYGSITPIDALMGLGIYRLSGRIHELREMGADITTLRMETHDHHGNKKTYAKYVLDWVPRKEK